MNILAIRLARFGDVVLLLPTLNLLKASIPASRLTFLTDHRLAPLAELCPAIDEVMPLDRIAMRDGSRWASLKSMVRTIGDVRRRRFDLAIDFHGFRETNLLAWLSGASQRVGMHRFEQPFLNFCFNLPPVHEDKRIHVSAMFQRVAEHCGLPGGLAAKGASPILKVPEAARQWLRTNLPSSLDAPYAGFYVDAPTTKRIWPAERFAALADFVVEQMNLEVVVVAGLAGAHLARRVRDASRHSSRVHCFSNLTIPQLAAVVESAQVWLSNDTGPMHLGPILNVPTLGLFSIGLPEHFKPTGLADRFLRGDPIETITVEAVAAELAEMRVIDRRDLRR